jgi:hypothetical protein
MCSFLVSISSSVLERQTLIGFTAVTIHDAMQLVRLSKPRSGAKYSLISYFFVKIGPRLSLAREELGPWD